MRSLITIQQRSENGYGFESPGLKMGVENGIFWSEIGSEIEPENRAARPYQEFRGVTPSTSPGVIASRKCCSDQLNNIF